MLLKRIYDDQGKITGVKVLRAHKVEHLSPNWIEQGAAGGYMTLKDGKLVVHGEDDVSYQLLRTPGYYCCHCDKPLDDGDGAKAHLAAEHADAPSPDPTNPAGYRRENFYTAVSDTAVENMTAEEAARLDKQIRAKLHESLGKNYRRVSDGQPSL